MSASAPQATFSFLSQDYLQKGGTSAGSLESLRLLGNMSKEFTGKSAVDPRYVSLYEKEVEYLNSAISALDPANGDPVLKTRFSNDLSGAMALADLIRQEKIQEEVRMRLLSYVPASAETSLKAQYGGLKHTK